MRILILSNLHPPVVRGGYEQACANVATALAGRGHEVRVLTSRASAPRGDPAHVARVFDLHWFVPAMVTEPGARALQLHQALCSSHANSVTLADELRRFEPDVAYVWNLFGIGVAGLLDVLARAGVPQVVHLMDRLPGYLHDNVPAHVRDVFGARGAAPWTRGRTISMSLHLLDELARDCGFVLHGRADIVPGWAAATAPAPHAPFRQDGVTRFVFAGAIEPHKGVDLAIEASAMLARTHDAFTVDFHGAGDLTRYVDHARRLGVADRLRFHGPCSQAALLDVYAARDAFLFPSWVREPFGFAPVEAAGCGTPAIITDGSGAAERFVDGVHCVKIERSATALADAMRGVVEGTIDIERLGRAAQRLAREDLSFATCLDAIERVLEGARHKWNRAALDAPMFDRLTFTRHDLSVRLRFGMI